MTVPGPILGVSPRAEAWVLLVAVVASAAVVLALLVGVVRRRLLRPLPRTPTDATDSWAEAGRRLKVPGPPGSAGAKPGSAEAKPGDESDDPGRDKP